jgi:hypothetical protein
MALSSGTSEEDFRKLCEIMAATPFKFICLGMLDVLCLQMGNILSIG